MTVANFEPIYVILLEVVEYFKQLEVFESAKKARGPQNFFFLSKEIRTNPKISPRKLVKRKNLLRKRRSKNLPMRKMNLRNSARIARKIIGPARPIIQQTVAVRNLPESELELELELESESESESESETRVPITQCLDTI